MSVWALLLAVAAATAPGSGAGETDRVPPARPAVVGRSMSAPELEAAVARIGGIPFRREVPLRYLDRAGLNAYLDGLLDDEYPASRAEVDQKTLVAFDLLAPGTDLRRLRRSLLAANVVGFYDERPGRKSLYAVSTKRRLTPANQTILAHELRHAIQDQYIDVYHVLPETVGDFDDRRLAFLSLLEGDAMLVMERFVKEQLPGARRRPELPRLAEALPPLADAPRVLRDQLVAPYFWGRDFVRAIQVRAGWRAVQRAWSQPPVSTEQVLHPEKYLRGEVPLGVPLPAAPPGGRLLGQGVLGELLLRSLLDADGDSPAAAGWGGDRWALWDVGGRNLLTWRSQWDSVSDWRAFQVAVLDRFGRHHGPPRQEAGFEVFSGDGWTWAWGVAEGRLVLHASDDPSLVSAALRDERRREATSVLDKQERRPR